MARISAEMVTKRENFLRGFMEKAKQTGKSVTLESANEALVAKLGKGTPKMRAERVYEIRDEIMGAKGKGKPGRKPASESAASTPTGKRGPGRPRKVTPATNGNGADTFVLHGDVKHLLALAQAAGITVTLDEAASQAVSALRASA
jgi:hypothetical protein